MPSAIALKKLPAPAFSQPLLHHATSWMRLARLIQVLDAGLVDHNAIAAHAQLHNALVVPLNDAMQLLAVFQNDSHLRLLLHLLLKIKCLCVTAFRHTVAVGDVRMRQRIFRMHRITAALGCRRQMRTNQLASSVERIVFLASSALALDQNFLQVRKGSKGPKSTNFRQCQAI